MYSSEEILAITIKKGKHKVEETLLQKAILGFIGGAMIALGYLLYVRVVANNVETIGNLANLIGAALFPIGLIIILLAGGELVTGNMMVVGTSFCAKVVSFKALLINCLQITFFNIVGAVFVAYFFGHLAGLTSTGVFSEEIIHLSESKLSSTTLQTFLLAIGCNWFVGLSVWLNYGAKAASGKIMGIWFCIMTFVAIGFQHSVANAFVIPAAIFEGGATWLEFIENFLIVWLGNSVGGIVFVAGFYYLAFGNALKGESTKTLED